MVRYELSNQVAVLTLNHPEKRNALSREMLAHLKEALERAERDPGARAVIVRAEGSVFSAGHDLRELAGDQARAASTLFGLCADVMETIRKMAKPVIAQVQGLATAGGCQLVASCDFVVASEKASFAAPGVKIGLFCTTPAVPLCRVIPTRKALEMLYTGAAIDAHEAERLGLVNRVVPADKLAEETMKLAQQILTFSSDVLGLGKRAFYAQLPLDIATAYEMATHVMVENALMPNAQEGIRAFLEKRAPQWQT